MKNWGGATSGGPPMKYLNYVTKMNYIAGNEPEDYVSTLGRATQAQVRRAMRDCVKP